MRRSGHGDLPERAGVKADRIGPWAYPAADRLAADFFAGEHEIGGAKAFDWRRNYRTEDERRAVARGKGWRDERGDGRKQAISGIAAVVVSCSITFNRQEEWIR